MQLFRINRLPLFNIPDAQAGDGDPPPVDPAVVANTPPPADPPAADPAASPAAEPAQVALELEPTGAPEAKPRRSRSEENAPKWARERISEEAQAKLREKERADAAEAELARLRAANTDPAVQVRQQVNDADLDARAEQIAEQKLAQRQLHTVISAGVGKYNDWDDRMSVLGAAGAASEAFAMDVVGVDPLNAHEILYRLSDDPDKAARLAKMTPVDRTRELIRMSMSLQSPASAEPAKPAAPPRRVSNAPPPPPAIEPGATQTLDWRDDKVSDADFSRGWEENVRKRGLRR